MTYLEHKQNALLMNNIKKTLPKEYQKVEYIKPLGNAYIDIDYYCGGDVDFELDCSQLPSKDGSLFRTTKNMTGNNWYTYGLRFRGNNKLWLQFGYDSTENSITFTYDDENVHNIKKIGREIWVDGQLKKTLSYKDFDKIPFSMYVFARNNDGSPDQYYDGAIHHLIFTEFGEVTKDLIPCYRKSDNEIGMYDTVTQTFYTNSGSGTFTKGNDV